MEGEQRSRSRSRVRKPLSDCTNTIAKAKANAASSQSSSSSLLKPQKPLFSSAIKKLLQPIPNTQTNSANSTTSSTAPQNDDASQLPPPAPLPSTPSRLRPPTSSSASGRGDVEALEPCSVYGRRQTSEKRKGKMKATEEPWNDSIMAEKRKSKGKAIAENMSWSCPPATKIQKIGEKMKEDGGNSLSKTSTVPSKKKQGRPPSQKDAAKHALSQEFIEQQRAYFAEIDAFELPEEEVESVAELD